MIEALLVHSYGLTASEGMVIKTKLLGIIGLVFCIALFGVSRASATSITYHVDMDFAQSASVIGNIITDGDTSTLGVSDILGWNFVLSVNGSSSTLSDANSEVFLSGAGLTASASALTYNFGAQGFFWFNMGSGPTSAALDFDGVVYVQQLVAHVDVSGDVVVDHTGLVVIATTLPPVGVTPVANVGLPGMALVIGVMGLIGWCRERRAHAVA